MNNTKIFIVSIDKNVSLDISKKIVEKNDDLSIIPIFSTDTIYKDKINDFYIYYLNVNVVNLSYKNNSLLYVITDNYISHGITLDDFYNNDIAFMNIEEYNNISDVIFDKYNVLTIWIDFKQHMFLDHKMNIELKYFNERIRNNDYMYFLDNDTLIYDIINKYINANEEERLNLLKENI
jgi:hypothetical protein